MVLTAVVPSPRLELQFVSPVNDEPVDFSYLFDDLGPSTDASTAFLGATDRRQVDTNAGYYRYVDVWKDPFGDGPLGKDWKDANDIMRAVEKERHHSSTIIRGGRRLLEEEEGQHDQKYYVSAQLIRMAC